MLKNQKLSSVIVAGGSSQRFAENKLLLDLAGKTVLERSVRALTPEFLEETIVVCPASKRAEYEKLLRTTLPEEIKKKLIFINGGSERWQSSLNGIKMATGEIVAIHDAARPLVAAEVVKQNFLMAIETGAVVTAAPAVDSIKLVDENGFNYEAIERSKIWLAQTPQTFRRELILQAYEKALVANYEKMTDESELITKFLHLPVSVIAATAENLKITFPRDFKIAQLAVETV